MKTAKEYRAQALDLLRGNWKPYVMTALVVFVAMVVSVVPVYAFKGAADVRLPGYGVIITFTLFFFLLMPLAYAFCMACLEKYRKAEGECLPMTLDIFRNEYGRGVRSYLRIVLLGCLIFIPLIIVAAIAIVLIMPFFLGIPMTEMGEWIEANQDTYQAVLKPVLLLCMIPYMIWVYAVVMTPYLAHDRKELSIRECMALSKLMMKGYKWKYFCFQMSFMGWVFLAALPVIAWAVVVVACKLPESYAVFGYIGYVGMLWLIPYMQVASAAFYEDLLAEHAPAAPAAPAEPADVAPAAPAAPAAAAPAEPADAAAPEA